MILAPWGFTFYSLSCSFVLYLQFIDRAVIRG
jgi:hypothetical protein